MSNQGDDCYFYFYSTCTKGDSCPFRHCEAALGNETVCTLWQERRCFRSVCRFRHMEIDKKRSEIPCFWENQPVGCQKLNCAFHHNKGRFVDGLFLPPSKILSNVSESTEEEIKATQISLQQNKLSVQSNPSPQMRGVMKVENSENVPSPTHPPVVINAADDDEDDDDQLSEEGDESKIPVQQQSADISNGLRIVSTRKVAISTKQDKDTLNFGIKTLEEIKSKKIKEKTKQSDKPSEVGSSQTQAHPGTEKNVRTVVRTVTLSAKPGEEPRIQLSVAERLGKRKASLVMDSGIPLKRSLAERLGKKIESPEISDKTTKRVQVPKSLKERLGLPAEQNNVETENAAKPGGEIRVKTLEEIRLEKASQRKEEAQPKSKVEAACTTDDPSPVTKTTAIIRIKTFSEVLAEKKQRQQEDERTRTEKETLIKPNSETELQKQGSPVSVPVPVPVISGRRKLEEPSGKAKDFGEVRIKTLEEIKQEKALRMQQSGESTSRSRKQPEQTPTGRKLLCITKPTGLVREEKKILELKALLRTSPVDASTKTLDDSMSNSHSQVHVKSLDEIRKEKQLKQQQERKPQEEQTSVSSAGEKTQGKSPVMANIDVPATTGKTRPLSKRLLVRSQEAVTENVGFEDLGLSAQPIERRSKAKPKVNVKPSGMKSLSPAKQALKRKATESQSSAIAAVKPLSPIPSSDTKNLPSENMAVICVPGLPEATAAAVPEGVNCNSSELNVDNQEATTLQAGIATSTSSHAAKTRRLSSTGTGKAPVSVEDDFEKLIWEISGGKLEAEIDLDPGKDEDDLLLELSEMIDS